MEIFQKPGLVDEALGKLGKPYAFLLINNEWFDFESNDVERRGEV